MMKAIVSGIFFFILTSSFAQITKVKEEYGNGSTKAIGKVIICTSFDKSYSLDGNKNKFRKIGSWKYYYQNGNIKRIENYKRVKDCSSRELPDGKWQYFDEQGVNSREDEYKDGILWNAEISKYYCNKELVGIVRIRNGVRDTLKYINPDSSNMIKNGDFSLYVGPPRLLTANGQNRIEDQIPFWISSNAGTPDYYNQFRRLNKVPDNFDHELNANFNYVGIILYHEPTGTYSEYITGELNTLLKHNQKYCMKLRIRLSQNSAYYIDKLGVYFSQHVPSIANTIDSQQQVPQLLFNIDHVNRDQWLTISNLYTAIGDEKNITLGRFSSIYETAISTIKPVNQSEGEYNQSAYYLIDKVELTTDTSNCTCIHRKPGELSKSRVDFDLLSQGDSMNLNPNRTYVLNKIYFDFDKFELLPSSYPELKKLLAFLNTKNVSITINGHTDSIGTEEYNKALSFLRAKSVTDWLIENGIDKSRIRTVGYGSSMPVKDNITDEHRTINRRVEFSFHFLN